MAKPIYYAPSVPFINGSIIMPMQADERLIKNDVLQLLMTAPGERVMRPEYGTELRLFPFEMLDNNGIRKLRSSIADSLAKYENRFIVSSIVIDKDEDHNSISIKIYGYTIFGATSQLFVELNLPANGKTTEAR